MSTKTVTLRNAVDAVVEQDRPSKERARGTQLLVQNGEFETFIFFSLPVPRNATIVSATLRLYTAASFGGDAPSITVQRVSSKWNVSKLKWSNKPGSTGPSVTISPASTGDGDEWAFNVASILQPVANGSAWYGLRITTANGTLRRFRSAQAGSKKPTLTVTWSEAPDKPTTLSPSSGQAVNAAKPVLEMNYNDDSGSTTLAAAQVQVDDAADLVGAFDSGEVAATGSKARVDLAATAYAGLAEGGTAYWRGRVKDAGGSWSDWSAVTSWTRTAKGVVTIDSPGVGGTLTDFTPTILWSFSKVQSKAQVIVRRVLDGTEVFDSGEFAGTDQSVAVQSLLGDAVLTTGVTYEVEVRAWDDEDRIGTTDDPAYSVAFREFTIIAGATTGVTNLRFESRAPLPGLVAKWDRVAAPDGFTILRDGVVIETNVEPDDIDHDGLTWTYPLTNVRPNIDNEVSVAAVTGGVASPLTTETGRVKVAGAWLLDLDETHTLFIAGTSGSTITLVEDGETLVPVGAGHGIRITQGVRGYEGTVSGVLISEGGKTVHEWVEEALAMRANPGVVRRFVMGTEAFDVVVSNLTVRPTGDSSPGMRPVSFDFVQVSDQRVPVVL
jgi:hypothetical protein